MVKTVLVAQEKIIMQYKTKICVIDPNTCLVEHWEGVLEPIVNPDYPDDSLVLQLVNSYFSNIFNKFDKYSTDYAIGVEYYEPC